MSSGAGMSPMELRAALSLAAVFGLRMFGMFAILPVFAIYAERLPGGEDLALVGVAIGGYALTQAALQIPFGWWSDRYGRKPVIQAGLAIFAVGSFIAALGQHLWLVIAGRLLQGAGAIAAPVMALAADLTREEHRTKAMAMIGAAIGSTFALSLVLAPWLDRLLGVPGIFFATGVLVIGAMGVVHAFVPEAPREPRQAGVRAAERLARVLCEPQLARLNYGIFALHAVLMALFIAVPLELRAAGLPVERHWQVYLPALAGSFLLMLPAVAGSHGPERTRLLIVGSVAALAALQLLLPGSAGRAWALTALLLGFFTAFNVLEALLPALASRLAPPGARGIAIGVFTTLQFLGIFFGAAAGGYCYGRWGVPGVVVLNALLLVIWIGAAFGMRVLAPRATCVYALPELDPAAAEQLRARLQELPGVHDARITAGERRVYLTVDSSGFDEENVLKLIGEG